MSARRGSRELGDAHRIGRCRGCRVASFFDDAVERSERGDRVVAGSCQLDMESDDAGDRFVIGELVCSSHRDAGIDRIDGDGELAIGAQGCQMDGVEVAVAVGLPIRRWDDAKTLKITDLLHGIA